MDCGSGVVHRMAALGIDWMGITHLAITHFHPDHVSDVPNLIQAWRYGAIPPRSLPLTIIGPPGTDSLLARLADLFGAWVKSPGFPLEVVELAPDSALSLPDNVELSAHKVPHTEESVAYSVSRERARIVYTGDTGVGATLGPWANGCNVLLAECSLPEELAIPSHLTPARVGALAAEALPGLLALTHFYPPVEAVDIRAVIQERFGGKVELTTDGWKIEIEDS